MSRSASAPRSPGKRWETTTSSAMQDTARQALGMSDRSSRVKDLNDRKIMNTKTSIRFGNDAVNYVSDTRENQNRVAGGVSAADRATNLAQIKKMKADLTVTNFRLGDEAPIYETTSRSAALTAVDGLKLNSTGGGGDKMKEMIKKSSLHFGNEPVEYTSVAHQAMEYRGTQANFTALKEEVGKMATNLRKHNFSFGEEKVHYQSDYNRGFGSVPLDAYKPAPDKKTKMKAIIEDSRSCHFSLGNDRVGYVSNTQAALREVMERDSGDQAASIERARDMKAALQKTSFIIGDDEDYM